MLPPPPNLIFVPTPLLKWTVSTETLQPQLCLKRSLTQKFVIFRALPHFWQGFWLAHVQNHCQFLCPTARNLPYWEMLWGRVLTLVRSAKEGSFAGRDGSRVLSSPSDEASSTTGTTSRLATWPADHEVIKTHRSTYRHAHTHKHTLKSTQHTFTHTTLSHNKHTQNTHTQTHTHTTLSHNKHTHTQ